MRPVYLEFCGINSFSERAEVDFNSLLEFGIFGIFGDTGSGKSTVLDCIGFALYGAVSRSRTGSIADVINYKADRAFVNFEFEITYEGSRRRFRVEREVKRKNAVQSVKVYEQVENGAQLALSEGVRESNALLEKIVGLEQRDFEKCIALPQGEFAQFVRAQRSDRLKLVSRLFDLEEYGERLIKKVNARFSLSMKEYEILSARLEPYAEITEANVKALKEECGTLAAEDERLKNALQTARAEEQRISVLYEKAAEAQRVNERLTVLDRLRDEIRILESELANLERASTAIGAAREKKTAQIVFERAENKVQQSEKRCAEVGNMVKSCATYDFEHADEEIAKLTEERARVQFTAGNAKKRDECLKALQRARTEYASLKDEFAGFRYEEQREKLERELGTLGTGEFLEYATEHGKSELLRAEYALFQTELQEVYDSYPETAEKILPLIEKYATLSVGDKTDFAAMKEKFAEQEKRRAELNRGILDLERRNGLYRAHLEKLQQLQTEGVRLKKEFEEYEKLCAESGGGSLSEIEKRLADKKRERKEKAELSERATNALAEAEKILSGDLAARDGAKVALLKAQDRLKDALTAGGFPSEEAALALTEKYGDAEKARVRVKDFQTEYAALASRKKELQTENISYGTQENLRSAREKVALLTDEREAVSKRLTLAVASCEDSEEKLVKKRGLEKEHAEVKRRAEVFERLKKLFEGNKFMEFVAEEYLQNVTRNASGRLLSLTDGRYFLRYDGGFSVGDNFNGGNARGVYTLSGGETFLVSLSLALALSAEICARSLRPIEFFFLDEGFGTLDERLVDTVMDSLFKLKNENFSIGIISHVEELKHRIDRKLTVRKATEKHGSQIQAE